MNIVRCKAVCSVDMNIVRCKAVCSVQFVQQNGRVCFI